MRDRLTVVIPHRRDPARLRALLTQLAGERVIVVDDSDDGIALGDRAVVRVRLGGASGFARAANAGLEAVRTPIAVVLNDDARPEGDCLAQILAAAGDDGRPVGPVILGPQGTESAGLTVRPWGRVVQRTAVDGDLPMDVSAISGACILLSATARFDPRFPHGFEDVDLCRRLGGAILVPTARCWHEGGGTLARTSPEAQQAAVTGQMLCFAPGWREPVIAALHLAQVLREGGPGSRVEAIARGWMAARRSRNSLD